MTDTSEFYGRANRRRQRLRRFCAGSHLRLHRISQAEQLGKCDRSMISQ